MNKLLVIVLLLAIYFLWYITLCIKANCQKSNFKEVRNYANENRLF